MSDSPKKNTTPRCPLCDGRLSVSDEMPGRVICKHCEMSFDRRRIEVLWDGDGYDFGDCEPDEEEIRAAAEAELDELWAAMRAVYSRHGDEKGVCSGDVGHRS